jgi:hypothetical protein
MKTLERHQIRTNAERWYDIKLVILAWMPESSAMDGNCMSINNIISYQSSRPCDWIPASMLE